MAKEQYKLSVEPITCVHIGNGEQLSPLDYKVSPSKQGRDVFVKFSTDSILKRIAADQQKFAEFDRLSSSENMKDLVTFVHNNFKTEDINYICHCTKEFVKTYKKNTEKDPLQNGSFVEQMYRNNGSGVPIIPGSSLKGAVRTAVLNAELEHCNNRQNLRNKQDDQIQKKLLEYSDAKNDPFRILQFGDCIFSSKGTQIVGMLKNIKTRQDGEVIEDNTSQIQAEAIKGYLMNGSSEACLTGEARFIFDRDLENSKVFSKKITIQDIVKDCNEFYFDEFMTEYDKFYRNTACSECDRITVLLKELKSIAKNSQNENECIIRVGRWSQVEFVTLETLRNPKTKKGKNGKPLPYGTTRTVFNNDGFYLPFGWCKCTFIPMEEK